MDPKDINDLKASLNGGSKVLVLLAIREGLAYAVPKSLFAVDGGQRAINEGFHVRIPWIQYRVTFDQNQEWFHLQQAAKICKW